MMTFANKRVLVVGSGRGGRAACGLLRRQGARVSVMAGLGGETSDREGLGRLGEEGVEVVAPRAGEVPTGWDWVVVEADVEVPEDWRARWRECGTQVVSELEFGAGMCRCLAVAVTGTNGKSTTARLVEGILTHAHRRTAVVGEGGESISAMVEGSRDLDYLVVQVGVRQLAGLGSFRPVVGVVTNVGWDGASGLGDEAAYGRAVGRLFANQQTFDWAIIQREALDRLTAYGVTVPSKTITFSARDRRADLGWERGMVMGRMEDWSGPLVDLGREGRRGPHWAEDVMAAMAVGRVLRIPLEEMAAAVQGFRALPHRCEVVGESGGVTYVDDGASRNVEALRGALQGISWGGRAGEPNVWLIAGGGDRGGEWHDVGPEISQRVRGAFLLGPTRERMRAAWGLFTPCTLVSSLLEAVTQAASVARPGDVVLWSPACSSLAPLTSDAHGGEVYRRWVEHRLSSGSAALPGGPP